MGWVVCSSFTYQVSVLSDFFITYLSQQQASIGWIKSSQTCSVNPKACLSSYYRMLNFKYIFNRIFYWMTHWLPAWYLQSSQAKQKTHYSCSPNSLTDSQIQKPLAYQCQYYACICYCCTLITMAIIQNFLSHAGLPSTGKHIPHSNIKCNWSSHIAKEYCTCFYEFII